MTACDTSSLECEGVARMHPAAIFTSPSPAKICVADKNTADINVKRFFIREKKQKDAVSVILRRILFLLEVDYVELLDETGDHFFD